MSLNDNGYQKNKAQKRIDPLTSFLEDIQCLQGQKTKTVKPSFYKEGKQYKTLDRMLLEAEVAKKISKGDDEEETIDIGDSEDLDAEPQDSDETQGSDDSGELDLDVDTDEDPEASQEKAIQSKADEKEDEIESNNFYIGSNQRYFMGAGSDPLLTIVTSVGDDKIKYYQYPWKKEQVIKKDIGTDLLKTGCQTWLEKNQDNESTEEDLKRSIESVINGKPGEKVALDDYQFANIQVRYTGSAKGDEEPWKELEKNFNINVGGVLSNKQTYNVRLTNRALQKFEDELRQAEPEERNFKIVKIMKEEEDFASMTECFGMYPMMYTSSIKPKMVIRNISDAEMDALRKMVQFGLRNSAGMGEYSIGETVIFKDEQWIIAEFITWTKEPAVLLVRIDYSQVADQVALSKIRKLTPEELSGLKTREELVSGLKTKTLDLPKSKEDGITKDIVKEKKQKKLNESFVEGIVEDLTDFIDNDPDVYKKDFKPIAENLTEKWNDGEYNRDLALNSFKKIVESASKKFFIAQDGEYDKQTFSSPKEMIPEDVSNQVAMILRKSFENQAKTGMISEAIEKMTEGSVKTKHNNPKPDEEAGEGSLGGVQGVNKTDNDSLTVGTFHEEDPDEGSGSEEQPKTSKVKENVQFTDKEINALSKVISKEDITGNTATLSFDDEDGSTIEVTITKEPQPQQKSVVYSANTTKDGELDKERTKNSSPFKTEDNVAALEKLLADLNIQSDMNEEKKVDKTITKTVNTYKTKDGHVVKSEIIGNVRYRYITKSDKKKQSEKRKMERKKKKIRVKKASSKIREKPMKPIIHKPKISKPAKKKSMKEETENGSLVILNKINDESSKASITIDGKQAVISLNSPIKINNKTFYVQEMFKDKYDTVILAERVIGNSPVKVVVLSNDPEEEPVYI